jgi:hypothetical protein
MSTTGDRPDDRDRPFPSEAEWLSLPLPDEAARTGLPSPGFVDAVADAIAADAQLDRDLAQAGLALPRELLAAHTPPEPSPDFVARTLGALQDDRRARWQRLLARHVAPGPSPFFVARTLAALRNERQAPAASGQRLWRLGLPAALLAAAATALLVFWPRESTPRFERQLLAQPAAFAHAVGPNALAPLLAWREGFADPTALPNVGADGLWLLRAEAR